MIPINTFSVEARNSSLPSSDDSPKSLLKDKPKPEGTKPFRVNRFDDLFSSP